MRIERLEGGNLEENGYFVIDEGGKDCYIIDPGYGGERYLRKIAEEGLNLLGILLTHHHGDHVGAIPRILASLECPVYMHGKDAEIYRGRVDVTLAGGEAINLGAAELRVIHTPGHTEGSLCYHAPSANAAFTGDTIFNVDIGRTDLHDGDPAKMAASIKDVVSKWPNGLVIYPGHGDPANMKFVRIFNRDYLEIMGEMGSFKEWKGEKFIL
ncbi:MAG: MBL fold metallo-hydrolase [Clostridiales Family XIII bacterium]|jgi:glyoxylase-like metal-dependent hydrolase (beta-lactamase superfamily II)|nr:MBL fold metallo-hydrolase [Clostridiales Family XIII bacterium]